MIGMLVGGKHPERHLLVGGLLDLPRTGYPHTIAIQKQADHHLRLVGRLPTASGVVIVVDPGKVQLPDHIADKVGQMALFQPVIEVRRQ